MIIFLWAAKGIETEKQNTISLITTVYVLYQTWRVHFQETRQLIMFIMYSTVEFVQFEQNY